MQVNSPLSLGFNSPYRKKKVRLSYRLFSNKRKRIYQSGWPLRWILASRTVSRIFDIVVFWEAQGRLPNFRKTGFLNDFLFELKAAEENIDLRRRTTDKQQVKTYLLEKTGLDYAIPTLAVLGSASDLDAYSFPSNSVVKPTHMSGIIYHCGTEQPGRTDLQAMKGWFDVKYDYVSNEQNYAGLKPKIIVEPLLSLNGGYSFDLRFFVFAGEVTIIEVVSNRFLNPTIDFFDPEWNHLTDWKKNDCGHSANKTPKPKRLQDMLSAALIIGQDFSFIRVDFFTDFQDQVFICELTHISGNCRDQIVPLEADRYYVDGHPRNSGRKASVKLTSGECKP